MNNMDKDIEYFKNLNNSIIDKQDVGLYKFLNSKRILDKIKNNQSTK